MVNEGTFQIRQFSRELSGVALQVGFMGFNFSGSDIRRHHHLRGDLHCLFMKAENPRDGPRRRRIGNFKPASGRQAKKVPRCSVPAATKHPFDEGLKLLAANFAGVVKPIIETVNNATLWVDLYRCVNCDDRTEVTVSLRQSADH